MPTISQDGVRVLPMYSRSAMSLEEIQAAMGENPPQITDFRGGWASTNNHQSNLGLIGGIPPASMPVIEPASGVLPRMLVARFYYWAAPPAGMSRLPGYDPRMSRRLAAVDVMITEEGDDHIGILFSTRVRQVLNQRDGAVASLQKILQSKDATIRIDRFASHMALQDTDFFLWLTVQVRDKPQVASDLRLDKVSGISGRDASSRTADLRAGVDFSRPNFLTAVAEADTLGPIDISFVHLVDGETRSFQVKVHIDGGFEIRKNELHVPSIIDSEELMRTATLLLAYSLIPRFNELYIADGPNWADRRIEVIESAMTDLERRYASAKAALQERFTKSPSVDPD